jgi:hypothetical protein
VLRLVVRPIADADRPRVLITGQVLEDPLGQVLAQLRSPPGVSGSEVVAAAAIAPVGAYMSPFSVSALRWSTVLHGWSGNRPRSSQCCQ